MEEKKKELIDLVKSLGRVNLDELSERLKVDKKELYVWAEELRKKEIFAIEPHFLKAPDLVATDKLRNAKKLPELDEEKKEGGEQSKGVLGEPSKADAKEPSKALFGRPAEPSRDEAGKPWAPAIDDAGKQKPSTGEPVKEPKKEEPKKVDTH